MMLLANGLVTALGVVSAVFPAILIAAAVLMLIGIKRQKEEPAAETPATPVAEVAATEEAVTPPSVPAAEETKAVYATPAVAAAPFVAMGKVRYNKSFKAKLIQSSDDVKEWYTQLKNAFLSYKKTASRLSWQADSVNSGRQKLGKFVMRGKTLCLYLALDPDDYAETKYKVERASGKRYESVPCMYRIKGMRRVKYALDLIAAVAEKYSLVPIQREPVDYRLPYEETQALIDKGLIRRS